LARYPNSWPNLLLAFPVLFWPTLLAYVARRELLAAKERPVEVTVA
jgi:hypothetical protein